jgi:hypothetical protein
MLVTCGHPGCSWRTSVAFSQAGRSLSTHRRYHDPGYAERHRRGRELNLRGSSVYKRKEAQ